MVEVKIESPLFFDLIMTDQLHDFGGSRVENRIDFPTIRQIWQNIGYESKFMIPDNWNKGKKPKIKSKTENFVHNIFDEILEKENIPKNVEKFFEILTLNTIPDESPFTDAIRAQLTCPDENGVPKYPEKWLQDGSGRKPKLPVKFFVDAEVGKSIGLRLAQLKYSQGEMVTISKFYDQAQTENLLQTSNYISLCENNIIAMKQEDHEEVIKGVSCIKLPNEREYRIETNYGTLTYVLGWEIWNPGNDSKNMQIPIVTHLEMEIDKEIIIMNEEIKEVIIDSYKRGGPSASNMSKILNEYSSVTAQQNFEDDKLNKIKFCCLLSKSLGDLSQLLDFYWYNANRERKIKNYYLVTNDKSLLNVAYFIGNKGTLKISNPIPDPLAFTDLTLQGVVEGQLRNIIDRIFWSRPDKGNFKKTTYITKFWKQQYLTFLKDYDDQETIEREGMYNAMQKSPSYKKSCAKDWDILEPSSIMTSEEAEKFERDFQKMVKNNEITVFEDEEYLQ